MKKWTEVQIKQLGRVVTGKTPPTSDRTYFDGPYSFISPKDLGFDSRYISETLTTITLKAIERFKNQVLPINSIMFTSLSYGFGKMGLTETRSLTNQQINSIIVDEANYDFNFVYYLLRHYKDRIFSYSAGVITPIVPKSVFEKILVAVPRDKILQTKIASILSAYDDLIENNLKRIKLLEEKAFLMYKSIVKIEKLEKHILSKFGTIITGKTPSTTISDYFGSDVLFIKTPDMHNQIFIEHTDQMLSELGAKSQEKKFLPPFSLCVSCIGTAGIIGITSKPSQTNQQINAIVFYERTNVYFFYALMSQMKEQLEALGSNGLTFTNVNKNKFENMEVFVPNQIVLNEFAIEFEAPFSLILSLQKQNTKLKEARDILLPKLMNGQIQM